VGSFQRQFLGIQNLDTRQKESTPHAEILFLFAYLLVGFVNGITDCIVCPIVKDKPKTQQLRIRKPLCELFLEVEEKETRDSYVAAIIETQVPEVFTVLETIVVYRLPIRLFPP